MDAEPLLTRIWAVRDAAEGLACSEKITLPNPKPVARENEIHEAVVEADQFEMVLTAKDRCCADDENDPETDPNSSGGEDVE